MKRLITLSFLAAALPLAARAQTGAGSAATLDDLLKAVPDDPVVVVAVPNLGEIASGLQAFGAATGIPDLAEVDADLLYEQLGVYDLPDKWEEVLDKDGPFVFALTDLESEPVLICTVTKVPETPTSELIEVKGNMLIAVPDAEVQHAVHSTSGSFAKRFAEQIRPMLAERDVAVFFDMSALSAQIQQMLAMGEMLVQMGAAATSQPTQVNTAMITWMFGMLRTALDESRALVLAGSIDGDGLLVAKTVHFDPAGKIADYLGKIDKPEKDPLRGLPPPGGTMILAGEWRTPGNVETMSEKMLDIMLSATTQPAEQAERPKLTPEVRKAYRALNGYSAVVAFGAQSGGMRFSGVYLTEQSQTLLDAFDEMWKVSKPMMANMAPGFTMELSEETEMVGSVEARVYHFKFDTPDENLRRMLRLVHGELTTLYIAPHPEGVACAMGPAELARADLEKILNAKSASLSSDQRVAGALKRFSPRPQAFMLLDFPQMMSWAIKVAELSGGATLEFKPPKTPLPYVGLSICLHETAIGAELFVPAAVVKYVVEQTGAATSAPTEALPY